MTTNNVVKPPLPKPTYPTYQDTLPYSKREYKYRPFTVGEQRSILTAAESDKSLDLSNAIVETLDACTGMDTAGLATVDFEHLCLKLKGASVDNELKFSIIDPDLEETVMIKTRVDTFEVVIPEGFNPRIKIGENAILEMRVPSVRDTNNAISSVMAKSPDGKMNKTDYVGALTTACMYMYYHEDSVFDLSEYDTEQKIEFLDGLTDEALKELSIFFDNLPYIKREIVYKRSDGTEKTLVIEGLTHFFK